ncbi:MAG: hypothetical protein K6G28_01975 [Acholeplasmatales bacterium]|nr:hypothetical protein [Acholeplasmatales bacterium]
MGRFIKKTIYALGLGAFIITLCNLSSVIRLNSTDTNTPIRNVNVDSNLSSLDIITEEISITDKYVHFKTTFGDDNNLDCVSSFEDNHMIQVSLDCSFENGTTVLNINDNDQVEDLKGLLFVNNNKYDILFCTEEGFVRLSDSIANLNVDNCSWIGGLINKHIKSRTWQNIVSYTDAVINSHGIIQMGGSIAQTTKANSNYDSNKTKALHDDIDKHGYITQQYLYSDWYFGFATIAEVGCEIIATYNAMIDIGKKQDFAKMIFDFEMSNIMFDIGFGHLGSNPRQIYRYLDKYGVSYDKYNSLDKLKNATKNDETYKIIFTSKNDESFAGIHAIHTFFIEKSNGMYHSYNSYDRFESYDTLDKFVQFKFDYAYIVR